MRAYRFPSNPLIMRVPFYSEYSALIRRPTNKKRRRVLLENLGL